MNLKDFAKSFLIQRANPDGVYVDFTMGNGHDTAFLCQLAKNGKVYAFDVQEEAVENTHALLDGTGLCNAELILSGHENVKEYVKCPIDGGMFNLGYRPGGDKSKHTMTPTTLKAVRDGIELLKNGCVITVSVYPGHDEGSAEGLALGEMLSQYDKKELCVMCHKMINSPTSPYIYQILKY